MRFINQRNTALTVSSIGRRSCAFLAVWCSLLTVLYADEKDKPGFEITGHHAHLQMVPSANAITCVDTLSIHRTAKNVRNIKLGLLPVYAVSSLVVNEKKTEIRRGRDFIEIEDIPSDSSFRIIIGYSGQLVFRSEFSLITRDRAVLREEEILPRGPRALNSVRFSLTVPRDWRAISIGRIVVEESTADSSTYVWEFNGPLPNVGWICAGKFWNQERIDGPVPISVHLFEEDSASASKVLSLANDVLKFYNSKFLPYRFGTLTIVEVDDWVAGKSVLAIAVPGFIMVKKLAFTTEDKFNQAASVLPHEIAHQWWPATVFIEDQDAAFLSEGMCEYSALLFAESHGTMTLRDSLSRHPLLRSLMTRIEQGKDLPLQQKADLRALPTHYLKASYVHNMLRHIVGDSVLFRLYREYAHRFAGKTAGLTDFKDLAQELSGQKLDWFFDQWVKKRGIPRLKIYNVKSTPTDNQWITRGRVRMVGYEKYTTLASVGVETATEVKEATVWLGADSAGNYHNDVPFEVTTNEKPARALLDPGGNVLKIQKLPPRFGDLREPEDGLLIVGTLRNAEYLSHLARKDSAEMDKSSWSITIKDDTSISLGDLQRERVFLYGKAAENRIVADLEKKFPLGFHGDSVVVKNDAVFDSTLALLQIIESPYISHGLLGWIAPLSVHAEPELLPYDFSWTLVRGKDVVSSGVWEIRDEDLEVRVK